MPIPQHKNTLEALREIQNELISRTSLTNFDRDSKTRVLADVFAAENLNLREEQIQIDNANLLSNARGRALDDIGDKLGLPRLRATHASTTSLRRNIAFYVESGTFGAINGGNPISIPAGQYQVSSDPNSNELNTTVDFLITESLVLSAASAVGYATARAVNIGSGSNVGKQVLRSHNFTDYTQSASRALKVVNFYSILNGIDDEADDLYRFRLANHYNRLIQNNDTRMRLTALTVPGIVNSKVESGYFGIGTAGVFALGPENQVNLDLMDGLQQRLDSLTAPGGKLIATAASEVKFDFFVEVSPTRQLTNNQIVRLKADINKAFLEYFRRLTLGSTIDLSTLLTVTQRRIASVASFVQKGTDQVFKKVYVRKGFSGAATDERSKVILPVYSLAADEFASLGILDVSIV